MVRDMVTRLILLGVDSTADGIRLQEYGHVVEEILEKVEVS
jgi:hypothetical protein